MRTNVPGIYSVFKVYLVTRLIADLALMGMRYAFPPPGHNIFPWADVLSMVEVCLIFVYLSWGWLIKKMGKAHLPVAIVLATLGPFVEEFIRALGNAAVFHQMQGMELPWIGEVIRQFSFGGQFHLAITLFLPLILLSWQYRYRWVIIYALGLALINTSMVVLMIDHVGAIFQASGAIFSNTVFYLLAGYIINHLVSELRQSNLSLEAANRSLASHAQTLEQLTVTRERNRLAREFHDTLAHTLSAVAVQLEAVYTLWESAPSKAKEILAQSLSQTRQGLTETRRAIQALRASPLEDLGLCLAIRNLALSYEDRQGLRIQVEIPDAFPDISKEVEHSLYRILEEALRNTAQHANAQSINVSMTIDHHILTLKVQDDGIGFDQNMETSNGHFGIRGIKERAESIGATLNLITQPGQGTTLCLQMEVA